MGGWSNIDVNANISPPNTLCSCGLWYDRDTHGSLFFHDGIFKKICLLFLWLWWVFVAACGLSLAAAVRSPSPQRRAGFLPWLLLWWNTHSRRVDFSCCGSWALELWLSTRGPGPQVPCGVWNLPRAEIKPVSLASQGRFLTAGPPGKPLDGILTSI